MTERDSHRRIIGYTPEPEWDDTERAWMLALAEYERGLCPSCGLPAEECQDPLMPTRWVAEVETCQTQLMRNMALSEYRKDHSGERPERLDATITRVRPREHQGGASWRVD